MKPRKTLSVYVLLVGVLGLSIVGGILTFQIFSAALRSQLSEAQTIIIKPIDGSINPTTIENLEKRIVITDSEINQIEGAVVSPTPTTAPQITEEASTESAEITTTPAPTSTESATTIEQ